MRPRLVAERDAAVDLPEPAELRRRLARLAGLQQLADMGRGIDRRILAAHRLDHRHPEAVLLTGLAQQLRRAAAAVAEGAIMADDDMRRADRADHDFVDKRFGALLGEGRGRNAGRTADRRRAGRVSRSLTRNGVSRNGSVAGQEHVARVRLEGQHAGRRVRCAREFAQVADQRRMAAVQPVEIAHRQHRAARVRVDWSRDGG